MRPTYDVLVVGAGPAGSTAAQHLSAEGLDVAVLEEHAVVGEPVDCTGIVGADAFADFDLAQGVVVDSVRAVTLHSPGGIPATYQSSAPLAYVVNRAELDRSLARRAQEAGATFILNAQAVDIARNGRGVKVLCRHAGGETCQFSARMVILAGGPRFAFHERLGLGSCVLVWRSAHAELPGDGLPHAQVFLGRDVAPGAFAWAVPVKGSGKPSVRVGVNSHGDAPQYLEKLCREKFSHLLPGDGSFSSRPWSVPILPLSGTYGDRVLAIGDAAGQVKPTSGGGIYYGMLSAREAARTVAEVWRKSRLDREALSAYERRWRARLGFDLKIGTLFRRLFVRMTDQDIDDLFLALQRDGLLASISEKVSFDWHGKLILFLLRHPALARILVRRCWDWRSELPLPDPPAL